MSATETTIRKFTDALHDVILHDIDEAYLKKEPEKAFRDAACQLLLRLQRADLTVLPAEKAIVNQHAEAAVRIFDTLTQWMQANRTLGVEFIICPDTVSEKLGLTVTRGDKIAAFSQGSSIQDACAQVAQTIICNEGTL